LAHIWAAGIAENTKAEGFWAFDFSSLMMQIGISMKGLRRNDDAMENRSWYQR
jgi:hypothetical protein